MRKINVNNVTKCTGYDSTYPKGGFSCSKDSFVGNQTLVFQIAELLFISPNTVNNQEVNSKHKPNGNGRNSLQRYSVNVKERLKMVEGPVKLEK